MRKCSNMRRTGIMKTFLVSFCLAVLALLPGCTTSQTRTGQVGMTASIPYVLDSGDVLRVDVFGQRNLSNRYTIDGSGKISMPLLGPFRVRGMTTQQAEVALERAFGRQYLRNPNVTVEVATYRPFFILGEVIRSGQYPYVNGMTAQTAIAIAGGYSSRADQDKVLITRRRADRRLVRFKVPVTYPVRPGDTVFVPERFF